MELMAQCTYIHIKHAPVKFLARISLAFCVFLILQTLFLTFPFHDLGLVSPIHGSEDVEQAALE
jgi:hypothetical protein